MENAGDCILADDPGLGKALESSTPVLTNTGWKPISNLCAGVDWVYGSDGELHNLLGVYPQGERETYKVIFSDKTEVFCDKEHLWTYQTGNMRKRGNTFKTGTLREIMNTRLYYESPRVKKWNIYMPMIKPINFCNTPVDIDPYVLGLLVGDGSLSQRCVSFTNSEKDIIETLRIYCGGQGYRWHKRVSDPHGYDIYSNGNLQYKLRELGLMGKKSQDKFLPDIYLYNDIPIRTALLQGLIDTDGEVIKANYVYSTTSNDLAQDVKFLVESLGGTAYISDRQTMHTYLGVKKKGLPSYRLNIKMPYNIKAFRSDKHNKKYKPGQSEARRTIRKIEYVGKMECTCISVDSPDKLFVINSCILTHNTLATLALTRNMERVLVVSPKTAKDNWHGEAEKWQLNGQLRVIEGSSKAIRQKRLNEAISNQSKYIAVHYDMLDSDKYPQLFDTKWDCILFDEAHYMKTREQRDNRTGKLKGGKKHSEARKLMADKKIFMTGTPFTNNAGDCWSMLNMIDPKRFGSYWTFVKHFAVVEENYFGTTVKGLNDLHAEDLKWLLSRYMIRREKDIEAKKVFQYHNLSFGDSQKAVYDTARKNYIYGDSVIESDVERFIRLMQVSCDPYILGLPEPSIVNAKISELLIRYWEEKIIVGTVYLQHVENIKKILGLSGRKVFGVTGEAKNKKDIVDEFKAYQGNAVLIATITSITESLSIDECHTMILADLTFSPTKNWQFFNRIHRLTSTKDKTYHILVTPDVNEHKQDLLKDKQVMIDALTRGEAVKHYVPDDLQKVLMEKIKNIS